MESRKTIGLFGSMMLLTNNLAGPTISVMPNLVKAAGWLPMIGVMLVLAFLSGICAKMLLSAMRRVPDNQDYESRVEFTDLMRFYMSPIWFTVTMASYFGYLVLTLMSYIIQTAQVLDYASVSVLGCAYGLELYPHAGGVCGTKADDVTPFGEITVVPLSFLFVALICVPMAWQNLDDNIVVQWVAIVGLTVLAGAWLIFLVSRPGFPLDAGAPVWTLSFKAWRKLFGVLLFNFALMSALPSWVNEKRPEVSVNLALLLSMGYVVVVYTLIGIAGAFAYRDLTGENLFSKLNSSGNPAMRLSVGLYPILQNLTSIPVFSIFIKYNLVQLGWLQPRAATIAAFAIPWALSIPFYTGEGFENVAEWGGFVFSLVINFAVPVALYSLSANGVRYGEKPIDTDEIRRLIPGLLPLPVFGPL